MLISIPLADPQLVGVDPGSLLWVLGIFLLVLIVLYKPWQNVLTGLKAREAGIRKDIADAEAARKKAEETLQQYSAQLATAEQKVRDLLTQAQVDAEKISTNIRVKAQQESEEIKENAAKEIEAAKRTALAEIYTQTADLATSIAEKIIRRSLNPADQRDLVDQGIQQFQHSKN